MHADAGTFPSGIKAGHLRFAPLVSLHATHLVMGTGSDGYRRLSGIHASKFSSQLPDLR